MKNVSNFNKLLTFFDYVFWFFMENCIFLILNIPLILYLIFIGFTNITEYFPLFLICCIPFGASFTALLYTMGKIIKYKDIFIVKDFFKSYKRNFIQATCMWIIELFLIFILYTNIISSKNFTLLNILMPFFVMIIILIILMTPILFILLSRFEMKTLDLLRTTIILCISNPLITISNLIVFLFSLVLFELKPSYSILFITSLICYLLMYINNPILVKLEKNNHSQ